MAKIIIQVQNIDQGTTTKVSINDVKILIDDFSLGRFPVYAIPCKINGLLPPNTLDWSPTETKKVNRYFARKVKKSSLQCFVKILEPKSPQSETWTVDMELRNPVTLERARVVDELVELGLCQYHVIRTPAPRGEYRRRELGEKDRVGKIIGVSRDCTLYFSPGTCYKVVDTFITF